MVVAVLVLDRADRWPVCAPVRGRRGDRPGVRGRRGARVRGRVRSAGSPRRQARRTRRPPPGRARRRPLDAAAGSSSRVRSAGRGAPSPAPLPPGLPGAAPSDASRRRRAARQDRGTPRSRRRHRKHRPAGGVARAGLGGHTATGGTPHAAFGMREVLEGAEGAVVAPHRHVVPARGASSAATTKAPIATATTAATKIHIGSIQPRIGRRLDGGPEPGGSDGGDRGQTRRRRPGRYR